MMMSAGVKCNPLRKLHGKSLVAACLLLSAACSSLAAQSSSKTSSSLEALSGFNSPSQFASSVTLPEHIISPVDVLSINVYDAPHISREYRVGPSDVLDVPLRAEDAVAAHLTPA